MGSMNEENQAESFIFVSLSLLFAESMNMVSVSLASSSRYLDNKQNIHILRLAIPKKRQFSLIQ